MYITRGIFPVAEIYLASGKLLDAEDCYRDLINRNPENYGYYSQLEKCLKFGTLEKEKWHTWNMGLMAGFHMGGGGRLGVCLTTALGKVPIFTFSKVDSKAIL